MNRKLFSYHLKMLERREQRYDEDIHMLAEEFDSPNAYHTKLKKGRFHRITENSIYALGLLDGGNENYIKRANDILRQVIALQCNVPGDTFGLWPYFKEETLEEMDAPDWNTADFNGIYLLQILLDYSSKIEEDLRPALKQACLNACSCIMRRDVIITYTNVAIMDIYMTLVCGAKYDKEIFDFGMKKLKKLYSYIIFNGSYDEYNSPTYSTLLVKILSLALQQVTDSYALNMLRELNDLAWQIIAEHYHPTTGEWAGPQLRAYTDFLTVQTLSFLESALDFRIGLTTVKDFDLLDMRYDVKCPEKYIRFFIDSDKEISETRMLYPGHTYPDYWHSRVAVSYLTKEFTLGSFHYCESWNQHRGLLSYIGTKENPYCLRLRVLHDFYDYCSAVVSCAQEKNTALAHIMFVTDRGDTHCNLDMIKNASIRAKDMRIRFQLTGNMSFVTCEQKGNHVVLKVSQTEVKLGIPYAVFGQEACRFEIIHEKDMLLVDMILYQGEEKSICFTDLEQAFAIAYISLGKSILSNITYSTKNEFLTCQFTADANRFLLKGLCKSYPLVYTLMNTKQYINDVWIEDKGAKVTGVHA